jgi:hypothetical protein
MTDHITQINSSKYNQEGAFDYLSGKWHRIRVQKGLDIIRQYSQDKKK